MALSNSSCDLMFSSAGTAWASTRPTSNANSGNSNAIRDNAKSLFIVDSLSWDGQYSGIYVPQLRNVPVAPISRDLWHFLLLPRRKSSGLNLHENAGLKRHESPAFTATGFADSAGLYSLLSPCSLALGDKGHESRISGPRFRPQDVFGRTLLRRSFRPNLVQRHVATI